MKKVKYLHIEEQHVPSVPVFFNYIEKFKMCPVDSSYPLLHSRQLSGYAVIEASNKIISSVIDFSKL